MVTSPEQNARIAQRLGLGIEGWNIHCPDLSTPEMQVKVKAALVARNIKFWTRWGPVHLWSAEVQPCGRVGYAKVVSCATEAEALLTAIDKLLGRDDEQ